MKTEEFILNGFFLGVYNQVDWKFFEYLDRTFVGIVNTVFDVDNGKIGEQALDSIGGFTLLVAVVNAFLEHNVILNLTADRFLLA